MIMKKFTFFLTAALFCGSLATFAQDDEEISITPSIDPDTFEPTFNISEKNDYYVIYMDEETMSKISDGQLKYIGPEKKEGRNLWMWDGQSYFTESPSGNNSFDVPGAYMSYIVGGAGWSGIGYNVAKPDANGEYEFQEADGTKVKYPVVPLNLMGINDDYKFHFAVKANDKDAVDFYLTDGSGHEAHLILGDTKYGTNEPVANFERDGEWYNIDVPMTYLEDNFGLSFKKDNAYVDKNIFCVLAGGNAGFTIDYDAVFFYGPKGTGTGIKDVTANRNHTVAEYYSIDGKKVSAATAKANKGIYIVKQDGKAKKIVID